MTNSKNQTSHTPESDLTHSMAHYLLTIHKLKEAKGYARVTDIAKDMGITKGSVSTAITSLKKKDLVVEDDSKFLSLSQIGHEHVHSILSSRTLLYYFLKDVLGVSNEVANNDSCLMEHLLSDETRSKFFTFMKKIDNGKFDASKINTSLEISSFENHKEFYEAQTGDKYLK